MKLLLFGHFAIIGSHCYFLLILVVVLQLCFLCIANIFVFLQGSAARDSFGEDENGHQVVPVRLLQETQGENKLFTLIDNSHGTQLHDILPESG